MLGWAGNENKKGKRRGKEELCWAGPGWRKKRWKKEGIRIYLQQRWRLKMKSQERILKKLDEMKYSKRHTEDRLKEITSWVKCLKWVLDIL